MKKKLSISLDEEVYEEIKKLGEEEGRTFSNQVNQILKDIIKKTRS